MTMNYDPNMTNSGRMAKQTVRLTFGQWEYRKTMEAVVGGNCTGLTVIECAVRHAYEELTTRIWRDCKYAHIELVNKAGDMLDCEDDEDRCEDWLQDMLIGAEIVAIEYDAAIAA